MLDWKPYLNWLMVLLIFMAYQSINHFISWPI